MKRSKTLFCRNLLAFAIFLLIPVSNIMAKPNPRQFAFDCFSKVIEEDFGKNILISPVSAQLALAMTYNGAESETAEAMFKALHLSNPNKELNSAYFMNLMSKLANSDAAFRLTIANSIWSRKDFPFKKDFYRISKDYFDTYLDYFSTPSDTFKINGWVREKTEDKIHDIIYELDPATIMILLNAVYFKADWAFKFDKESTRISNFTAIDKSVKKVPFMTQTAEYNYLETDNFQAVELPYFNRKLGMYIFLPSVKTDRIINLKLPEGLIARSNSTLDHEKDLKGLLQEVSLENWKDWLNNFKPATGIISLPKFKIEYEKELNDILTKMGMGIAFDATRADFSGLTDAGGVFIDLVRQKTYMEIDEEGTEAAAATVVSLKKGAFPGFRMDVNRPFFFAIYDKQAQAMLFMGTIVNLEE